MTLFKRRIKPLIAYIILPLIVCLLYFKFVFVPTYNTIKQSESDDFKSEMLLKSLVLDHTISSDIVGAKSMSSRSMIRKKIVEYKAGNLSMQQLKNYTLQKYIDGASALNTCIGAKRIVNGCEIANNFDDDVNSIYCTIPDSLPSEIFTKVFLADSNLVICVVSPIIDKNQLLGHDIIHNKHTILLNEITSDVVDFKILSADSLRYNFGIPFSSSIDTLIHINSEVLFLKNTILDDVVLLFSRPKHLVYNDLKLFVNRQLVTLIVIVFSMVLIIYIIQRKVRYVLLKEKTMQLQRANRELQHLNKTKDKLYSILAHDLRSPFNSILGFSELLVRKYDKYSDEKRKEQIEIISNGVTNTYQLLENLLLWIKSQHNTFNINVNKHNAHELIDSVINECTIQACKKGVSIENKIDSSIEISVDKNIFAAIIRNLLSNAIKFSYQNGVVEIDIIDESKDYILSVKDFGVGIKEQKIEKMFHSMNSSLTSTPGTGKEKGTGLGLMLCKELVEKHNGKIWVESKPGNGSNFRFTLPK